jgi:hypothetical protein
MGVKLTIDGNGKLSTKDQSEVVIGYGLSEGATPIATVDSSGEIPTMTLSGEGNNVNTLGETHPSSKLLLNNQITFIDTLRGSFSGKITSVSLSNDTATISAQSKFEPLNSVKTSPSFNGTLAGAFASYLELGGLTSSDYDIDASFESVDVVYPGWSEKLWVQLKLLCATVNAEMYFQENVIYVRPIAQKTFELSNSESEGFQFEIGNTVKSFISTLGKTTYVEGGIIKTYARGETVASVDAGASAEIVLAVSFSVDEVNQPEYTIESPELLAKYVLPSSVGTVPDSNPNGFYCFLDKNGVRILPNVVEASGAGLVVEKNPKNPFELKIKVTGPKEATNAPWTVEFASGDPALMITGDGVKVESSTHIFNTGSVEGNELVTYPNNPFAINKRYLYDSAFKSAQKLSGPNVIINLSTDMVDEADNQEFGFLPGAIFKWNDSTYRIESVSYDYGSIGISAVQYVTFSEFNTLWDGLTYQDFTDTMFDPATNPTEAMSFSDFAIIPLMEPV